MLLGVGTNSEPRSVSDEFAILAHVEAPCKGGRAPNASYAHAQRNDACGDWVRLALSLVTGHWSLGIGVYSGYNL